MPLKLENIEQKCFLVERSQFYTGGRGTEVFISIKKISLLSGLDTVVLLY